MDTPLKSPDTPPPASPEQPRPSAAVVWTSEEILKGTKEIQILHHSEIYRLRLTKNDKLILSK
jgi:hemin uptake protein HemP